MRCAAKDRDRLDSAFRDIVRKQGTVRHLIPMIQVEIVDLDPTTEEVQVQETVRKKTEM